MRLLSLLALMFVESISAVAGPGGSGGNPPAWVPMPRLSHPTQVSAGAAHACVIDEEGVKCWQGKSDEQIEKEMKESYSAPYRWGREIGVELAYDHPKHYEGVSYWQCPDCKTTFNRFTGVEEPCC